MDIDNPQHPPQTVVNTLVEYVNKVLCLDNYLNSDCIEDACRLKQVVIALVNNYQLHPFLTIFGHSSSCASPNCTKSCRMFKRIRSHIQHGVASTHVTVTEPHEHVCAIMHVYGQLFMMHVDVCVKDVCGIHSCKDTKKMREEQGHQVLPNTFAQKELTLKNAISVMPDDIVSGLDDLTI